MTLAGEGAIVSLVGDGIELATNLISGDMGSSIENVIVHLAGEFTGKFFDKSIPGPNPDLSEPAKEIIQTGTDIVKEATTRKVKEEVKNLGN